MDDYDVIPRNELQRADIMRRFIAPALAEKDLQRQRSQPGRASNIHVLLWPERSPIDREAVSNTGQCRASWKCVKPFEKGKGNALARDNAQEGDFRDVTVPIGAKLAGYLSLHDDDSLIYWHPQSYNMRVPSKYSTHILAKCDNVGEFHVAAAQDDFFQDQAWIHVTATLQYEDKFDVFVPSDARQQLDAFLTASKARYDAARAEGSRKRQEDEQSRRRAHQQGHRNAPACDCCKSAGGLAGNVYMCWCGWDHYLCKVCYVQKHGFDPLSQKLCIHGATWCKGNCC
eukprot:TRINITY_DN7313_c0_g1_i2.p1 TRINITY_DN7313_c0_g1~~TRINITY_DN7313_c0_g1_i2.p1  ORF type:complete len:286 (-),score=29.81 TRINITY_DN7313_c0_g1_i2:97-954(-)